MGCLHFKTIYVVDNVLMFNHHPLWFSCRARGIDHIGQLFRRQLDLQIPGCLCSKGFPIIEINRLLVNFAMAAHYTSFLDPHY